MLIVVALRYVGCFTAAYVACYVVRLNNQPAIIRSKHASLTALVLSL